jgi:hypothetical protein
LVIINMVEQSIQHLQLVLYVHQEGDVKLINN